MPSFRKSILIAGGLALALPSTSYAEAPFDLAKLSPAVLKTSSVSGIDRDAIIVLAVRHERPKQEEPRWNRTRVAAIQSEAGFLALSAMDAMQTIDCLSRNECVETNPLQGKHPSAAKLILVKAGLGALHFVAFKKELDRNPGSALRLAQISCGIQGSVVRMNARMSFK
jgi:hypothetical protein